MSVRTFLTDVAEDVVKIFKGANTVVKEADGVAIASEPLVVPLLNVASPALSTAFTTIVNSISLAEAAGLNAATSTTGSGDAKALAVETAVTPTIVQTLNALGVNTGSMTSAQISTIATNWTKYVYNFITEVPTLVAAAKAPTAPAPTPVTATSGALAGVAVPATPTTAPTPVAHESLGAKIEGAFGFHPAVKQG